MYREILEHYDTIFPFNPAVISLLSGYLTGSPARILDVGCGTGKYTAALADRHEVLGIDPDPESIALARHTYPAVAFRECDLPGFHDETPFDLIFCIGNVIAHIPPADIEPFVQRVRALLRPGGNWIFHTLNWDRILAMPTYAFPIIERAGITFSRHYRDITPERVSFETVLTDPAGTSHVNRVELFPLESSRIRDLHRAFDEVTVCADYTGKPFATDAMSQVRVYRR